MGDFGLADISLLLVGVLALITLGRGVASAFLAARGPTSVRLARRVGALRTTCATMSGLIIFAIAIALHNVNPTWEGVSFLVGPLGATAFGLAVFALMPPPTIEGTVRRRSAVLQRRDFRHYSSPRQLWLFIALFGVTSVAVLASGLTSKMAPDGRWLCTAVFPAQCAAGGPYLYPGWLFAAPALGLIAALLAALILAFRRIATAPSAAWPALDEVDSALRTEAVRLVFRIGNSALLLTLGLFLGAAGLPLLNAPVLDTGLSMIGASLAQMVGVALVVTSALAIVTGFLLAFASLLSTSAQPREALATVGELRAS